jgi:hypothetical protein
MRGPPLQSSAEFHSDPRYSRDLHRADMAWALHAASRGLPEQQISYEILHARDLVAHRGKSTMHSEQRSRPSPASNRSTERLGARPFNPRFGAAFAPRKPGWARPSTTIETFAASGRFRPASAAPAADLTFREYDRFRSWPGSPTIRHLVPFTPAFSTSFSIPSQTWANRRNSAI